MFGKRALLSTAFAVAATASVAGMSTDAHALLSLSQALTPGLNQLSDDSAEKFVNKGGTATGVDVGDIFLGAIGITSFPSIGQSASNFNEVSGLYALRVLSVAPIGGGLGFFTFEALSAADFVSEFAAAGVTVTAPVVDGTFAIVFEDTSPDFNRIGNFAHAANLANGDADSTLRLRIALADGGLGATAPTDVSTITGVPGAGVGGFLDLGGLSIEFQNIPGITLASTFGVTGNVSVPAQCTPDCAVEDDATFTVNVIPEPTTLGILGGTLLSLGALGRRRRKVA
jgi:hypothetical protein